MEARDYPPAAALRRGKHYTVIVSHAVRARLHVQVYKQINPIDSIDKVLSRRARAVTLQLPFLTDRLAAVYGARRW